MAQHPPHCEICQKIEMAKNGVLPGLVVELETGFVVLGESQFFRGYTQFLCKQSAPDLEDLEWNFRLKFLQEMALVSQAVSNVIQPHKMNVESLGNVVPHLHWHFFPRQTSEDAPEKPVWLVMPSGEAANEFALDVERDGELITALRQELSRLRFGVKQPVSS